jgi:glycosyltransferase involved in cell wall biosynthesis
LSPPYLLYLWARSSRARIWLRLVIAAYADLPQPAPQLVIAGKSWLAGRTDSGGRYRSLPLAVQARIILPGYVAEVRQSGACCQERRPSSIPSLYEGFGFPVLEAQLCGTAVICANKSSLPEVAGDGALLVDPLDTAALTAAMQQICHCRCRSAPAAHCLGPGQRHVASPGKGRCPADVSCILPDQRLRRLAQIQPAEWPMLRDR